MTLHRALTVSALLHANRTAVIETSGTRAVSYRELDELSDRVRDRLTAMGVKRGDRVGIYLRKSIDSIATLFGVLKAGAAYVPVDPTAPAQRNAYIHDNCQVSAVVLERDFLPAYEADFRALGRGMPPLLPLEGVGGGDGLSSALDALDKASPAPGVQTVESGASELAYILYTSGSTGKPKGVMLSHGNAIAFVDWCSRVFAPVAADVFSSHAPFHFDLSILDIFLPLKHGASLALIDERISKDPVSLTQLIESRRVSIWYSAPSILSLIARMGRIAELDLSSLHTILFAGEVFPVVHLRSLVEQLPGRRYFNLYGPTETNVCTFHEIPLPIPTDRVEPYPIGEVCDHLAARVVDPEGNDVAAHSEGELCISGPNVMQGYWGLPQLTSDAFLTSGPGAERWYRTGDLVVSEGPSCYRYMGRRDRMVKRRGYRVELGEIEACLYRHPEVREAAVIALPDAEAGVRIKAHLGTESGRRISIIELKTFCARLLPVYMVPDSFHFHATLAKTSTDKVDYQALKALG